VASIFITEAVLPYGAHLGGDAVVVKAVLPDAFIDEAIGLVATVHHSADEPARERWKAPRMGFACSQQNISRARVFRH